MMSLGFISGNIGGGEMLIVFVVFLLLFGAKKLPEMARGLGKSLEEFRKAARDVREEVMRAGTDVRDEVMKAGTEVRNELEAEPPTPVYPETPEPALPPADYTEPPIDVAVEPSTEYHPPVETPTSPDLPVDRAIEETALAAASLEQQAAVDSPPSGAASSETPPPQETPTPGDVASASMDVETIPSATAETGDTPPEKPA